MRKVIIRIKEILFNIFVYLILGIIIFVIWCYVAKFYPDEWFAEIPKFVLSLFGIEFN